MSFLSVVFRVLNKAGSGFIEPATADKQLPDNHQVAVSNLPETYPLPAGQFATLTPQHDALTNDQLRAAPLALPVGAATQATLAQVLSALQGVLTATVSGEVEVKNDIGSPIPVSGPLSNDQLRATPLALPIGAATQATLAQVLAALQGALTATISGEVEIKNDTGSPIPVSGPLSNDQLRAEAVKAQDFFGNGQTLADQAGAGEPLTFTFTSPVELVYVYAMSAAGTAQARCDPFGGVPSATQGIPCDDGIPVAIPVTASTVKVYAPSGMTVSVWGFRY